MRRHKFNASRTEVDGIFFDSKREAHKYGELKILQKAGLISDLKLQVKMPIVVDGIFIANYICDFVYYDRTMEAPLLVYLDVKGMRTPLYKLKKKLIEAIYRTKITEA